MRGHVMVKAWDGEPPRARAWLAARSSGACRPVTSSTRSQRRNAGQLLQPPECAVPAATLRGTSRANVERVGRRESAMTCAPARAAAGRAGAEEPTPRRRVLAPRGHSAGDVHRAAKSLARERRPSSARERYDGIAAATSYRRRSEADRRTRCARRRAANAVADGRGSAPSLVDGGTGSRGYGPRPPCQTARLTPHTPQTRARRAPRGPGSGSARRRTAVRAVMTAERMTCRGATCGCAATRRRRRTPSRGGIVGCQPVAAVKAEVRTLESAGHLTPRAERYERGLALSHDQAVS